MMSSIWDTDFIVLPACFIVQRDKKFPGEEGNRISEGFYHVKAYKIVEKTTFSRWMRSCSSLISHDSLKFHRYAKSGHPKFLLLFLMVAFLSIFELDSNSRIKFAVQNTGPPSKFKLFIYSIVSDWCICSFLVAVLIQKVS